MTTENLPAELMACATRVDLALRQRRPSTRASLLMQAHTSLARLTAEVHQLERQAHNAAAMEPRASR